MLKILFASFLLLSFGCTKQEEKKRSTDFEDLMGKGLPKWEFIRTKEDYDNLRFFRNVYESNISYLGKESTEYRIPKVLHFIWIGPKPFPRESVENVRSWIANNPDWIVKFWTDRERPLPHPSMQMKRIQDFSFLQLKECYENSDNYGEKSDVLRYEILYQEGGVYVDHDVKCFQAFAPLNAAYDLYCGMEMPYPTCLSSSVLPTNNLVGARASHPILKGCLDWLQDNWKRIEQEYPGKDKDAVINRVAHRTFLVLGQTFLKLANQDNNHDIALPTFYFNAPEEKLAIFARHEYKGSWFENESAFEKKTRERLMYISKKTNKIILFCIVMAGMNILGFAALFFLLKKRKTST